MTADGASFFLPIRQTSRNRSEHLGQVATAKAMATILSAMPLRLIHPGRFAPFHPNHGSAQNHVFVGSETCVFRIHRIRHLQER